MAPNVPHHTVVRAIGRGSYGEIWLARSLTSAWRAVKIVERARFEDTRAFDREFDGMAKFEPVSREHAGFVDILHVGRSEDDAFFYYVMELADDVVAREEFDPAEYVPKTLRSELQRVSRLPTQEVIALGLKLTSALSALHRHGLVHRDIKPANIIFVAGQPKIADIGLVSPLGQGSFVGTEGYVPPEGPGTAQADLYSLGKVLYELAMGKDRLDFPEVNTDLEELPDRDLLLRLNHVLWRACAHDSIERYATADEMHEDLRRVRDGEPLHEEQKRRRWLPIALAAAVIGGVVWWSGGLRGAAGEGRVLIDTDPSGVQIRVHSAEGRWVTTPAVLALPEGEHAAHTIDPKYDRADFSFHVVAGQEVRAPKIKLNRTTAAVRIESVPPGCSFELKAEGRALQTGRTPSTFDFPTGQYEVAFRHEGTERVVPLEISRSGANLAKAEFGVGKFRITSTPPGAQIFCDGKPLGTAPLEVPLPEGPHQLSARYASWPEQTRPITVKAGEPEGVAFAFLPGSVKITSSPRGADIIMGGKRLEEKTPYLIENLPPGEVQFTLELKGYRPAEIRAVIRAGEQVFAGVPFEARPGPRAGAPWENSLGMRFVPMGDLLVGVWPVRVRDYATYSSETGRARLPVDFPQDENHPVVRVNWEDATAFCDWLTQHERAVGKLDEGQVYRLPTDAEWSQLAGLPDEGGTTPEKRDGIVRDFAWGKAWPPPPNAGNFADQTFRQAVPGAANRSLAGYEDGFAHTSPVGTFPPNKLGIFDVTGNVWQWVADSYNGGTQRKDWGVLRGGSWGSGKPEELRLGYRNVVAREERDGIFGFRVVIVPQR
jgi:eukaryotic-like serine/threonine-protein kinase